MVKFLESVVFGRLMRLNDKGDLLEYRKTEQYRGTISAEHRNIIYRESLRVCYHSHEDEQSFHVYAWPISLPKEIDAWVRNFVWSGDGQKRKLVTVPWASVCNPVHEGSSGLRSIRRINEVVVLHLGVEVWARGGFWEMILTFIFGKASGLSNLTS
ncbi:hypothetical protein JHK87_024407 [Glycine soja]|nr:hypothetical protein JHK87_024407 [Glycine soja]